MSTLCCSCRNDCTTRGIVASVIIGIITAILVFTATVTLTPVFLWVVFGIAVVYLAVLVVTSALTGSSTRNCVCRTLRTLLVGILGTILLAVVLLAITFAATSVLGAIIAGALLLFFFLIITSSVCLVNCLTDCNG